jgi:polysaccharide deacetylase family protein (PEP-CTERM system associated)
VCFVSFVYVCVFIGGEVVMRGVMKNAFSVDVEDYYQVGAFSKVISMDDWVKWEPRIVANTYRILDILDAAFESVKGTFFVLGWIAERYPCLVPEIVSRGHEVASHGFAHKLVYNQTESEFRDDVTRTRSILREQSRQEVLGYRAPSFSITNRTIWAHRVLVEAGYRYDSSVFPIRHDVYNNSGAARDIHTIETDSGKILEFPPAVIRRFGQNLPVSGGGYFRFFPYCLTKRWLKSLNNINMPFVFYIHPWEIDPDQPRIPNIPLKSRFRHYINLKRTTPRLKNLLNDFNFTTIQNVIANHKL